MSDNSLKYYDLSKGEVPFSEIWIGVKVITKRGNGRVIDVILKDRIPILKVELEDGKVITIHTDGIETTIKGK